MIIAFDGSVCSGKTTIITELKRKEQILFAPEYMDLLADEQKILFDKMRPDEKLALLMQIDRERNALLPSSQEQIVLDRSVLCLFAFEYAKKAMNHQYTNSYLRYCIGKDQYVLPDKIIYFDVDEETRRSRCKKRGGVMSEFFLESEFNLHLKEFFVRMSRTVHIKFLDTSRQSINDVYDAVKREVFDSVVPENQDGKLALKAIFEKW